MKLRRIVLLAVFAALIVGVGLWAARLFPRGTSGAEAPRFALDSISAVAWKKANPWLFDPKREDSLAAFRDGFLLPLAVEARIEPRAVRRRGGFVEVTVPRGRPVHEWAYDLEQRAAGAGLRVVEGREVGALADQVEYALADAAGHAFLVRVRLGQAVAPGAYRMALVITELGRASAADRRAWEAFPYPVTLVVPDTLELSTGEGTARELLVELPMEPAAYPVVKPGPRALFIDHDDGTVNRILRQRLNAVDGAAGFATRLGDRAIENPPLMEKVLEFTADKGVLFLDLTGSPRSVVPAIALRLGAESHAAAPRDPGSDADLAGELERRAGLAQRSGEGLWVLRHAEGLPSALARVLRARARAEAPPRWVTLGALRRPGE